MSILDEIVANKKRELSVLKREVSIQSLENSAHFGRTPFSLKASIRKPNASGIIAEFKRRSPSKGVLNGDAEVGRTTTGYCIAGASGLSILTDETYFGGSNKDLVASRSLHDCPILRKDFTIDEYQVLEAKSIGADAILLIAAVLDSTQLDQLTSLAHSLKLEVLLEVHDEEELKRSLDTDADLIGVNNRSLKTFEVSVEVSKRLAPLIPERSVKISESGISDPLVIAELCQHGFDGFLVGETFMKNRYPEVAAGMFIDEVKRTRNR
jgi:indole-3-glycerol phosphate synthase